jgi:hypothetical protein
MGALGATRRRLLAALGLGGLAWTAPRALFADEPAVKAFLGRYRHAGGDKELKARDQAIDDVVESMNFLARGIARDKLKETNPIAASLGIAADAKDLTITLDTRTYTGPLNGGTVKVKSITGDLMDMHYAVSKAEITQVFSGDDRGRVNRYRLDSGKLTMHVRVHSSRLPKALVYSLTYVRA